MSYTKQTWQTGDTITAEKLNHIEDGVDDLSRQLGATPYYLTGLSTSDGAANKTAIQNALDTYKNVLLEKGDYPLTPPVIIDSAILDLNGSKITSTEYKHTGTVFALKGMNPTIRNGEVCANYDKADDETGYEFFENESLISGVSCMYENGKIENIDAHNCWGYAFSADSSGITRGPNTWERTYSGDNPATTTHPMNVSTINYYKTSKLNIVSGFKYLKANGGIGYNRIISQQNVKYSFYDSNDTLIREDSAIPRIEVEIPEDAVTVEITTTHESDFLPYYIYWTNYRESMTICDCVVHNNHSLGMTGRNGPTYVYNTKSYENGKPRHNSSLTSRATTGFCDIEDTVTPIAVFDGCESRDEAKFLMLGAFNAIVSNCISTNSIVVYRGWNVDVTNCNVQCVGCFSENIDTHVTVSNCTFSKGSTPGKNYIESNCIYTVCPGYLDKRDNFLLINRNGTSTYGPFTGVVRGRISSDTGTGMRYSIATAKGSRLFIENKIDSTLTANYGAVTVSGDCYGLITDAPHFPGGHTIGDCVFSIDSQKSFYYPTTMGTRCSGKFENCVFNLTGYSYVSNSMTYTGDNVNTDLTFENCIINNGSYSFFHDALAAGDKVTFINCTVADMTKIDSNGANCLAEIVVINNEDMLHKMDKITEVTVVTDGSVAQALDAGKMYHFTGTLTALTLTFNTPSPGDLAQYHFDFISGSTALTPTLPKTVVLPDSFLFEANKRYEVDVLNNYGAVVSWTVS